MNEFTGALSLTPSSALSSKRLTTPEVCWSEDATDTLVDAWGDRYLELKRGNLRSKHWQEVANAVNQRHGMVRKSRLTDVQCKNRMDTLKKRYKLEKARVSESGGEYVSSWPFYIRLDALIGNSFWPKKSSAALRRPASTYRRTLPALPLTSRFPVAPRSATVKRPSQDSPIPISTNASHLRRNFLPFSAAEAADSDSSRSNPSMSGGSRVKNEDGEGYRNLVQAVTRFGELYERVEGAKQRQMVELEKQRMQFAKDLEVQRMKLFIDMQVQLEKSKRARPSNGEDSYS